MATLTAEDLTFVERKRRLLKRRQVGGWIFIVIPFLCWMWMSLTERSLSYRTEQLLHKPPRVFVAPMVKHFEAANARLRALKTVTPLEAALVQGQIESYKFLMTNKAATFLATCDLMLYYLLSMSVCIGAFMLSNVRRDRRWLKILEAIGHDAH